MKMRAAAFAFWIGLAVVTIGTVAVQATVSTTAPRNDYVGTGATDTYSYTFRIFAATDLKVTTRNTAGVETTLTYPTDYTVTGVNRASGGTIVLTAGNLTTDYALTIRFNRTPRQSTDLRNQGSFLPQTHEDKFDELTRYSQQLEDVVDRSIHLPETEVGTAAKTTLPVAADRASQYLAFDASGNPIMASSVGAVPVSAYMQTVLDDTTAAAARTTLGAFSSAGGTLTGNLLFTDATYDIGASGATRPRDLFMSRNLTVGGNGTITGNLGVTGNLTVTGSLVYPPFGGHLFGLTLSNNGSDATNDIDIAVGEAASVHATPASRVLLALTSALTKRLDATWVTGTNQGGRTSSQAIANGTWHVCLMRVAGVDDVGFDTSATCANLITDHSATHVRRIGSILRESAAIVAFSQIGDEFLRSTAVLSYNTANPGTSAVLATLGVPVGVTINALCRAQASSTSVTPGVIIFTSPAESDQAPSLTAAPLGSGVAYNVGGADWPMHLNLRTNTSAQVRFRLSFSDANVTVRIAPYGWIDTRGQAS